jgi:aminopeptidase N
VSKTGFQKSASAVRCLGIEEKAPEQLNLNSEIEQVVLVLLLVLVLEKSRYLSVTLMERNGARRFGPCFDAQSQQIEHEHEHDF